MLSFTDDKKSERIAKIVNQKDKSDKKYLYFKDVHNAESEMKTTPKDLFKSKYQLYTVLDELGIEKHEFSILINLIEQNLELPNNVNMVFRRACKLYIGELPFP